MSNYDEHSLRLQKELEALPRNYTELIARRNKDIVINTNMNYNLGRFLIFLENIQNGISDKIRITTYGVDRPPTTSILFYDGYLLTFVVDVTRFSTMLFYYYYGYEIKTNKRWLDDDVIIDYNLLTLEQKEIPLINVWAGMNNN